MQWMGVSSTLMFCKGLSTSSTFRPRFSVRTACRYKSAVEPYFLSKMSNANREQMQLLVDSYWNVMAEAVAESRGIELSTLNRWPTGLKCRWHRRRSIMVWWTDCCSRIRWTMCSGSTAPWPRADGQFEFVTLGQYVSQLNADLKNISSSQIAIVYADGAIVDGKGYGDDIYGNTLAAKLAEVRRNDDVKAVVLRVNSPGGSAGFGCDLARDGAASGEEAGDRIDGQLCGQRRLLYFVRCRCYRGGQDDHGVDRRSECSCAWRMPLKNKLGITFDAVRTNTSADMGVMRPLTATERAAIMRSVDEVYETFTSYVAEGRNLPLEKVLDIAGGRAWSGTDALARAGGYQRRSEDGHRHCGRQGRIGR